MIRDNETTTYESLAGSSNLVKDCEHQASLVVRFKEAEEEKSVVVLSKTVPRGTNATEEKLFVDDDDVLQKILDPCLSTPSIKLVPINNEFSPSIPFERPTNMSDVAWEGCLDYNVVATRSEENSSWQTLHHPGWKNLLVDWKLEVDIEDENAITFQGLEKTCDVRSIKLEIDCKGGEELANKTYVQSNQLAGPFVVEGLVSETEYECRARMVNTEGGKDDLGPWTNKTRVKTLKEDKIVGIAMATGDNNEEASDSLKKEEVDKVDNGVKKAETTSVAPTAIGIGCVVVIAALAVAVAWRTMAGKKVRNILKNKNIKETPLSRWRLTHSCKILMTWMEISLR